MRAFGPDPRKIEQAAGIGEHETREFRDRFKGAHAITTGPRYRKSNQTLKMARAHKAWKAWKSGKLVASAAAGVRRDYAKEFLIFEQNEALLKRK